jgi:ComF family protein
LLLPVPLHDRRLRQRGFNQSLELARQLSRAHRLPLAANLLCRQRDTPAQHALPAKARRANIRGAFALNGDLSGRHIALLDDVMTTGHTVAEISRILRRAGATRIDIWVVARA